MANIYFRGALSKLYERALKEVQVSQSLENIRNS